MRDWKSILVSAEDSDDLSEALETLALDNGVSLLVTDADGASLYSAQYNPRGTMNTLPQDTFKELYAQAQASGGETQIEYMGSMQLDLTDLMRQVMLRYGKLKEPGWLCHGICCRWRSLYHGRCRQDHPSTLQSDRQCHQLYRSR